MNVVGTINSRNYLIVLRLELNQNSRTALSFKINFFCGCRLNTLFLNSDLKATYVVSIFELNPPTDPDSIHWSGQCVSMDSKALLSGLRGW